MPDITGKNTDIRVVRRTTTQEASIATDNLNETIHITNYCPHGNLILRNIPMIALFTTYYLHSDNVDNLSVPYNFNTTDGIHGSIEYITIGKYRIECYNHPNITHCCIQLSENSFYTLIDHITNVLMLNFNPEEILNSNTE